MCIASPALAEPDPSHPVDPLPAPEADAPQPPPPDKPADNAPAKLVPPAANPALPVVTISTMPVTTTVAGEVDHDPRTAAWISTGITLAFTASVLGWWAYRDHYVFHLKGNNPACVPMLGQMGADANNCNGSGNPTVLHREHVWTYTEFALGGATAVSGFITAWLWSKHIHGSHQVIVAPTNGGGQVSVGGHF